MTPNLIKARMLIGFKSYGSILYDEKECLLNIDQIEAIYCADNDFPSYKETVSYIRTISGGIFPVVGSVGDLGKALGFTNGEEAKGWLIDRGRRDSANS